MRDPPFIKLAEAVFSQALSKSEKLSTSDLQTFEDLLEARKLFKHSGILVDPSSNAHLFDRTVSLLDELCLALASSSLFEISLVSAVEADVIRSKFEASRKALTNGYYKDSLEETAKALSEVFWGLSDPISPTVGKPSAEESLILSGKGVDPANFLAMQQLLPLTYHIEDEPRWTLREFGHAGNWTEENAHFCLRTAIDTVVKLQSATGPPVAFGFHSFYKDVIEIVESNPEVLLNDAHFLSFGSGDERQVECFEKGDRISGMATGYLDEDREVRLEVDQGFDIAEWISLENPQTDRLESAPNLNTIRKLWFRKKQVTISYEVDEQRRRIREESEQ